MAKTSNKTEHYSSSHISIRYDVKDNFPELWEELPETCVQALYKAAQQGLDYAYIRTPYLPDDPRSNVHLRDSTFIQIYRNGSHGGTLYVQWRARNSVTGYHYGISQEYGNRLAPPATYENYTTPGTGPEFMEATWSVIEQMTPKYLETDIQNLIQENSVE
jgi:hypothetical protein